MKYKYISLIKWVTEVIRIKKGTMKMEFVIGIDPNEHDAFVKQHSLSNLLQSSNWAKVKDNWDHKRERRNCRFCLCADQAIALFLFHLVYTSWSCDGLS